MSISVGQSFRIRAGIMSLFSGFQQTGEVSKRPAMSQWVPWVGLLARLEQELWQMSSCVKTNFNWLLN